MKKQPHSLADQAHDIQGLILWGYGHLEHATYLLLRVVAAQKAALWVAKKSLELTPAHRGKWLTDRALNLAFTAAGLQALGLARGELEVFSDAFVKGMTSAERANILGDVDADGDRLVYAWGDTGDSAVHVLLAVFGADEQQFEAHVGDLVRDARNNGFGLARRLPTNTFRHQGKVREHFGFTDGIANPRLVGGLRREPPPSAGLSVVAPGEFIHGFEDEEGHGLERSDERLDVVWGGSYLAFRQLEQNPLSFWAFVREKAREVMDGREEDRIFLASKMVGRWPNGAPFVKATNWNAAKRYSTASRWELDDFGYAKDDATGHSCPIGAHLRRSNPRDCLISLDPDDAQRMVNRRRLLRRGRTYGEPLGGDVPQLEAVMALSEADFEEAMKVNANRARGLHFLCFNADPKRQFEFVQQSWINSPTFEGLKNDPDPIAGTANEHLHARVREDPCFTIPARPKRLRMTGFERFVTIRGGGYFFMPGINGLKRILEKAQPGLSPQA